MLNIKTTKEEQEKLQEITNICDKIETTKISSDKYKIKATKGNITINFSIVTNQDNGIRFVNYKSPFNKLKNLQQIIEDLYIPNDKKLQNQLTTIYSENNLCPICNSKLNTPSTKIKKCNNKCYLLFLTSRDEHKIHFNIRIFDDFFKIQEDQNLYKKINIINTIYNQISHWKENENYIAKLLK
ncbi:gp474 [Bacillus phage G]|uniref:Gp474 n=1 Tax=Bacillus phage G TaxID=2884420 RepID=G3MAL5_9CAUD|nr:gp474 [Bacillus phage G]AEO93732.1 gp474 [Bacillus phage G]